PLPPLYLHHTTCHPHTPDLHTFPTRRSSDLSFFDRSTRPRPARNVRFTSKSVQTLAHNETSRRAHRVLTRRSKAALIQSPYLVSSSDYTSDLQSPYSLVCPHSL